MLKPWISLAEVWLAFRKAKKEAYYSNTAAYGLKFVNFEKDLVTNLEKLHKMLLDEEHSWAENPDYLGGASRVPKSLEPFSDGTSEPHFRESDPLAEWKRTHSKRKKATATVRLVITASVEYLVISTIWALKVGDLYERNLITPGVYANRLRRRYRAGKADDQVEIGPVNWDSHSLYQSFHYQYGRWRRDGLRSSRSDLDAGHRVVGIALDISSFYDSIDAEFLLSKAFLKRMNVILSPLERRFTEALIRSFRTWCSEAGRECGIPIGLPSSGLIANLLMGPFDEAVQQQLEPSFYGRFVDDIYLSLKAPKGFRDGNSLLRWLVRRIPWLSMSGEELRVSLPYAKASRIKLGSKKQRVFMLEGQAGRDVITAIEEHMRTQASAHRMLPTLPESDTELKDRALLLNRDSGLATAVFREADFVTLRKAGLSEELSKMERISEVLPREEWADVRETFYDLAGRHLLAPNGFFEFYTFLPRVVGLMATNGDWEQLSLALQQMVRLRRTLETTTDLGRDNLRQIFANLAKRVELAALKCCMDLDGDEIERATKAIRQIRRVGDIDVRGITARLVRQYGEMLFFCDWSRQPFHVRFLNGPARRGRRLALPSSIEGPLRVLDIRGALSTMGVSALTERTWRGILFPTRAMPLSELTSRLSWMRIVGYGRHSQDYVDRRQFARWILALRGVRLNRWVTPRPILKSGAGAVGVAVGSGAERPIRIAVTNLLTEVAEWNGAAQRSPLLNRDRFNRLTRLINHVLTHEPRPDVLVMPELSLPRSLVRSFVERLGRSGIGLIAGLEYGWPPGNGVGLLNQAIVTVDLGSGYGQLQLIQTKNAPAWEEALLLDRMYGERLLSAPEARPEIPVYRSRGLYFGVLICSDLTNPRFRSHFQGLVDGLYVLEWNQDINSFNSLVEASALDIHSFIIQANNRLYGDGRIRGPMKQPFARDVIQLKGGVHDYFVVGEIEPTALRKFQSADKPDLGKKATFKPYPIGFKIAPWRKVKV